MHKGEQVKRNIEVWPSAYKAILKQTHKAGFSQLSDEKVGALLATLCASKPAGNIVELGTGTGLCTAWMLHGMCQFSSLKTVDNDKALVEIAKNNLSDDARVEFTVGDGVPFIDDIDINSIDLIFADTGRVNITI